MRALKGTQKLSDVVRQRVRETESEQWRSAMLDKTTLELYFTHKSSPATDNFYDNDAGSGLLFEARAGALRTLLYRQRFDTSPTRGASHGGGDNQEEATSVVVADPTAWTRNPCGR
ncbi:hypothetical protein HPB52_019215 [Rhipicephalus sanguineus]|uniref:Uncharacterized protein n=1 Tax=Rhipicephalus sanguineus TaxID=34632 RepID=A0A9D4SPJ8_RHISA|nr:hypothetical protein HPB52_019215 [Rhipicephalus sanguineus]